MCRNCEEVGLRPEDVPAGSLVTTYMNPNGTRTTYVNGKKFKRS